MNQNSIEIVFVATGDYAPFVATTALSIVENTKENVNFHVLTEQFKQEDENIIKDFFADYNNVSFEFIGVDENLTIFNDVQLCWFKSHIPYARILIPEILPQLSKVIYMDIDIICNCNIKELWDIDFVSGNREYALAAVEGDLWEKRNKYLNLSSDHLYFCNGLLVINCNKWREDNLATKLLDIAQHASIKFMYPTQDAFNICFDENDYIPFDKSYNSKPSYTYNHKCFHYYMEKPWQVSSCFMGEIFWEYAKRTPYYEHLQNLLKDNLIKREKDLLEFAANTRKRLCN